jgi:hypothetical protein
MRTPIPYVGSALSGIVFFSVIGGLAYLVFKDFTFTKTIPLGWSLPDLKPGSIVLVRGARVKVRSVIGDAVMGEVLFDPTLRSFPGDLLHFQITEEMTVL